MNPEERDTAAGYQPVSCEFHDVLESLATRRQPSRVVYRAVAGEASAPMQETLAVIADVFSRSGQEFIRLDSGLTIRLDQLVSVDGRKLAEF